MKTKTNKETLNTVVDALMQSTGLLLDALGPNQSAFSRQEQFMLQVAMQTLIAAGAAANAISEALNAGESIEDTCGLTLINPEELDQNDTNKVVH